MGTYYVYGHYISGEDKPFYIGKGRKRRLTDERRNIVWDRIVAKYGGYEVKIFETFENDDDRKAENQALKKEVELIAKYSPVANLTSGGEKGFVWTDEAKKHLSDAMKLSRSDPEWREQASIRNGAKPFRVYFKKKGSSIETYVGEWLSHSKCAEDLNTTQQSVSRCIANKRKTINGYRFELITDKSPIPAPLKIETNKIRSHKANFEVYYKETTEINRGIWNNASELSDVFNLSDDGSHIREAVRKQQTSSGFRFEQVQLTLDELLSHPDFKGDPKRAKQAAYQKAKPFRAFQIVELPEKYMGTWNNATKCAKELNLSRSKISKCLRGESSHHKGHRFVLID